MTDAPLTSGVKFDADKERFDLLPPEAMFELSRLYAIGAKKYEDRNWERGISYGRVFAALMRHAWKFWMGERRDHETGCHHMIAAAWGCLALFSFDVRGMTEFDDRPKGKPDEH